MNQPPPFDPAAMAADDRLLDRVAEPRFAGLDGEGFPADPASLLLGQWRGALDTLATAALWRPAPRPAVARCAHRRRLRIRIAAGGAAALAALSLATAATAAPGSSWYPLHRALFGAAAPDPIPGQVGAVLDRVAASISAAQRAGGITGAGRRSATRSLDFAAALLRADRRSEAQLDARLAALRLALAALPTLPAVGARPASQPPVTPRPALSRPAAPLPANTRRAATTAPPASPTVESGTDSSGATESSPSPPANEPSSQPSPQVDSPEPVTSASPAPDNTSD